MAGVNLERVREVLDREAMSISNAPPLLAKVLFSATTANSQYCFAKYTESKKWEFLGITRDQLDSSRGELEGVVEVERIQLIVPGPIQTNCWETAFYLAGLTACEGGSTQGTSLDMFLLQQVIAGKLKRVDSIDDADLVVNGCDNNPTGIVHAALRVDSGMVHQYLKESARMKELCASQLRLSMTPNSENLGVGPVVLIERFAASFSGTDAIYSGNDVALNYAVELCKLRKHPMFYSLV